MQLMRRPCQVPVRLRLLTGPTPARCCNAERELAEAHGQRLSRTPRCRKWVSWHGLTMREIEMFRLPRAHCFSRRRVGGGRADCCP